MRLNKILPVLCATAAATCLTVSANAATTATQVFDFSRSGPSAQSIKFFDTDLGALDSISFRFAHSSNGFFTVTSTDFNPFVGRTSSRASIVIQSGETFLFGLNRASGVDKDYGSTSYRPYETKVFGVDTGIADTLFVDTNAAELAALSRAGGGQSDIFPTLVFAVISPPFPAGGNVNTGSVISTGSLSIAYNYTTAAAAVPEPATWAMMLAGFGLIGGAMRRRQTLATRVTFA